MIGPNQKMEGNARRHSLISHIKRSLLIHRAPLGISLGMLMDNPLRLPFLYITTLVDKKMELRKILKVEREKGRKEERRE